MSRSSSLLAVGVDAVSLNSEWTSLAVGCSNSMIVILLLDDISLSAALICAFEMRCGVTDSAGCPVMADSEALSAFAAQDLRAMDRAVIMALIVNGVSPLCLHRPGHTATTLVD